LWQQETDPSIINAYRSYFSVVASAPIDLTNFTRLVNKYRQKPPFNFTNPLAKIGGLVQVTIGKSQEPASRRDSLLRDVPQASHLETPIARCAQIKAHPRLRSRATPAVIEIVPLVPDVIDIHSITIHFACSGDVAALISHQHFRDDRAYRPSGDDDALSDERIVVGSGAKA